VDEMPAAQSGGAALRVHSICLARRSESLPSAPTCLPRLCEGWRSGWEKPEGGCGFWAGVWADVTTSVGRAIGRWPKVTMVEAKSLSGKRKARLHGTWGCGGELDATDHIIQGDVVIVHDDVDVLVLSCSQETDYALRVALEADGYIAATEVLASAERIQRGGGVLDWITEMNDEQNNPAQLGHVSAGVTVDWGLHDGQLLHAVMLSTELGANAVLPPSTRPLRASGYEDHRAACIDKLTKRDRRHFARKRMTSKSSVVSGHVMLPSLRNTSKPASGDEFAIAATRFEGLCRSAASDLSNRYFASLPGVRALRAVQANLKWAEEVWASADVACECPFEGGTDYLYTKGSISAQGTKGWHDDGNGPACLTMWQNLGVVQDRELEMVVAIHGCHVTIHAGMGKFAHFMAWLPHRTQLCGTDGVGGQDKAAVRLHHTAYVKIGTEYAAAALGEYKRRRLPLSVYATH
jgi:hypothetical protein